MHISNDDKWESDTHEIVIQPEQLSRWPHRTEHETRAHIELGMQMTLKQKSSLPCVGTAAAAAAQQINTRYKMRNNFSDTLEFRAFHPPANCERLYANRNQHVLVLQSRFVLATQLNCIDEVVEGLEP